MLSWQIMKRLIVGLGNPGKKYQLNRHNIGFNIIDQYLIGKGAGKKISWKNKFNGKIFLWSEKETIFFKPQTFMNLSGKAVEQAANFYKLLPEDILIIHDDLDLTTARIKFKKGGGVGGHRGLESIADYIDSFQFNRLRFGIGRPAQVNQSTESQLEDKRESISNYVLCDFDSSEEKVVETIIPSLIEAIDFYFNNDIEATMNKYNRLS